MEKKRQEIKVKNKNKEGIKSTEKEIIETEVTKDGALIGASFGCIAGGFLLMILVLYFATWKTNSAAEGHYSKHSEESETKRLNKTDEF